MSGAAALHPLINKPPRHKGAAMPCPLCEKLVSPFPGDLVAEFAHSAAFLGPWQYHTGYCVLVSKLHVAELHHLECDVRQGFIDDACRLSRAIEAEFRPLKLNVESLGNMVPHLHWHIFPRRADDPERLKAVWLALDRADRDLAERARLETGPIARDATLGRLRDRLRAS
jgi:diadenosine tetraphosphate (Ap4A) HIT family hydrolase